MSEQSKGLGRTGVTLSEVGGKISHLEMVHECQDRTVEQGEHLRDLTGFDLTVIFALGDITTPVEAIFDVPVVTHEF
jgi:hypothetical protein